MKNLLISLIVVLFSINVNADSIVRNGNVYTQIATKTIRKSVPATKTDKVYKDKKGNSYPIYKTAKGKFYIEVASKKTGKTCRKYKDITE